MAFFDPTLVSLVAILGVMAITLGATVTWGLYQVQSGRLPEATRYMDIRERLALAQVELGRKQAELRELDQKIHERDRLIAEVQVHEQRLGELRLEWENLSAAREEIRKVKDEAAEAAASKAAVEIELNDLMDQVQRIRAELDPDRIADLERRKKEVEEELRRLQGELEATRQDRESALRIIGEARTVETRVEALRLEIERLETEIAEFRSDRDRLAADLAEARAQREAERRASEEARAELARLEEEYATLKEAKRTLTAEIELLQLLKDQSKRDVSSGPGPGPKPPEDVLADLVEEPACLKTPETLRAEQPRPEIDALQTVKAYLQQHGLVFSERTVNAFHTALKVNDTSQMTVLAGVSGTGKSLLPRRYAEAMGIHFLQVAVEPRWDSPQDLLGFYNYVEQKYRATDLARLLARLDPWRSLDLPEDAPDRRNHMALVLLDEMNLARVEYYFSEFLSRLEARPAWRTGLSRDACKDALIPVDIRGLDDAPRLFPSHNLLFVGTMNDDESTQSLSDKVLDRGNVLQFPAPSTFETPVSAQVRRPAASPDAQSFTEWRGWVRSVERLPSNELQFARKTIDTLSSIMRGFGRPFGHRLNQAILAYAANYPAKPNDQLDVRLPLADQIEFRILPKLRGVDVDQHQREFDDLDRLIRTDLDDAELAEKVRDEQNHSSRLFVWRGLTRRT